MEAITTETRIIECDPILLKDNPWQTRTHYDETAIAELAESIGRLGLLQPPIGRQVDNLGDGTHIELAFGHSRARACRHLGRLIPVEIREISDEDMARIAWAENRDRKDLTAVEEARALKAMIEEFNWTQEQLSAEVGLDRSTIANKLQLLKLPAEVQDEVVQGNLSERKASAILQFYKIPNADVELYHEHAGQWATPIEEEIAGCLDPETSSDEVRNRYRYVQSQIDRIKENIKREAKRAKAAEKLAAKLDEPSNLVDVKKLKWDQYDRLSHDVPGACSVDCPCRRKALGYDGEPTSICINPSRLRGLRAAATKERNKKRRERQKKLKEQFLAAVKEHGLTNQAVASVFVKALNGPRAEAIREAIKQCDLDARRYDAFAKAGYQRDTPATVRLATEFDSGTLLKLLFLAHGLHQLHHMHEYDAADTSIVRDYLKSVGAK